MSIAIPAEFAAGPLSAEHHLALADAKKQFKSIRTAAHVAAFNAWGAAAFAVLSAPFAMFSISGFLVTAGLALVAYNEFRGRKLLLRLDPKAVPLLGWNQLGFMSLIVVYCIWMMIAGLTGPSPFEAQLSATPELRSILSDVNDLESLYRVLLCLVYGSVIFFTILMQGGNALYYFTRRRPLNDYLQRTPAWIVDLQRAA